MKSPLTHLDLLDHLRGVAILGVLFFHAYMVVFWASPHTDPTPWNGWFRDFTHASLSSILLFPWSYGVAGVPIFFVVSGFCIHLSFQQSGKNWAAFFIRRFFRIYPAYLAALIFFTLLAYLPQTRAVFVNYLEVGLQFFTHFFFIHNFDPWTNNGINSSFWSLAVEVQLYVLYPVLLVLVRKLGWSRAMVLLAVCELVLRASSAMIHPVAESGFCLRAWDFISRSVFSYWFSWALGAYIADAFLKNQPLPFSKSSPVWWLVLSLATSFFQPLSIFWFTLFSMTTAVLVCRILGRTGSGLKLPAFSLGILKKFGRWSYSLYLLHFPLLTLYMDAIKRLWPGNYLADFSGVCIALSTWLAILPFSILWYHAFELPGIALGKRIVRKMSGQQIPKVDALKSENVPPTKIAMKYCLLWLIALVLIVLNLLDYSRFQSGDARQRAKYHEAIQLGFLAGTYDGSGRYDEAVLTLQKACELAAQNRQTNLLRTFQALLVDYQKHQQSHGEKGTNSETAAAVARPD